MLTVGGLSRAPPPPPPAAPTMGMAGTDDAAAVDSELLGRRGELELELGFDAARK